MTTFFESEKGKPILIYQQFIYNHQRDRADGTKQWICDRARTDKCRATAITNDNNKDEAIIQGQHNHQTSPSRVVHVQTVSSNRQARAAANTTPIAIAPPAAVNQQQLADMSDQTKVLF